MTDTDKLKMEISLCDRCKRMAKTLRMSWFNTQCICNLWEAKEMAHERVQEAVKAEREAVAKGDLNYPGIGLPEELKNG